MIENRTRAILLRERDWIAFRKSTNIIIFL